MDKQRRRIIRNWKRISWAGWWGDKLDVRFELARQMATYTGKKILDVGCGPGVLTAELSPSNVNIGLDSSIERLKHAATMHGSASFVCADFTQLPFRKNSFDVIVLGGVIELIADRKGYLADLKTLGSPGASIIATTPNGGYWVYQRHRRLLKLYEIEDVFSDYSKLEIFGYNPTPPLLPSKILALVPSSIAPYAGVPSSLLALIPGMKPLLRRLMRASWLRKYCKWFLITAE